VIRIYVVSAVRLYREALADLLGRYDGIDVVGMGGDVAAAVEELGGLNSLPNIVLLDMVVPESVTEARRLLDLAPGVQVLAVAVPDAEQDLLACIETGVSGFVTPGASLADLVAAIHDVAQGDLHCSASLTAALGRRLAALARDREKTPSLPNLTARELEILRLIDQGLSNKQIAGRLQIEIPTVKNHVHHILEKLGVHRRAEAAARVRGRLQPARTD